MKLIEYKIYVRNFLMYCLMVALTSSCSTKNSSFTNSNKSIYLGAYLADDILAPYPKLLVFERDSVALFNNKGEQEDITALKDSMLSFKDYDYFLSKHSKDQLTIYDLVDGEKPKRERDNILFRKLQKSKNYSGDIKKIVEANVWKYQSKHTTPNRDLVINNELQFRGDTLFHFRFYNYDNTLLYTEYEEYQFNFFELEENIFLSLVDSKNTKENQSLIYEITEFNSSEIKWINHRSLTPQIEVLTLSDRSIEEGIKVIRTSSPFYLCYEEAEQKLYYYYSNKGYYRDGAQGFLRDYKRLSKKNNLVNVDQNGYIIFQFKVNCEKKLGRYGLIQMDMNFEESRFDLKLIKSLFTVVNNSSLQWEFSGKKKIKDIRSFVMFKIQNGELIEVLP